MMDILMKPHSYDAVELVNDRYATKIRILGVVRYFVHSLRSSARKNRRKQIEGGERKRNNDSMRR
jgi:hypothetical protein